MILKGANSQRVLLFALWPQNKRIYSKTRISRLLIRVILTIRGSNSIRHQLLVFFSVPQSKTLASLDYTVRLGFVFFSITTTAKATECRGVGTQANHFSWAVTLSGDGRKVAFHSEASNLVDNDTNLLGDIFVHDRQTGQTTRVSVGNDGTQANGGSVDPAISADGRVITFWSWANNLVEDDTNDADDILVHVLTDNVPTALTVRQLSAEQEDRGFYASLLGLGIAFALWQAKVDSKPRE